MVFWPEINTFGAYANELSHQLLQRKPPKRSPTARNVLFVAQLLYSDERSDGSSIVGSPHGHFS